ncbi:MAG: nitroreductase family deazaflavin-dependent oxidoreductase [Chloroflexota bacterium]
MDRLAEPQCLHLTTRGRRSGLPREIEIWFASHNGRWYLVSELRERAQWVQNLRAEPRVQVRTNDVQTPATARVVDPANEPDLAATIAALFNQKYGWSNGTIVEITPGTDSGLPSP